MARRGRPPGKFTQHRRMEALVALLHRHPQGLSLYELAERLNVTTRSVRRYLQVLEENVEIEGVPERGGGRLLWRIPARELPRKVELRRTQAYALLAARRVFEPFRGTNLHAEVEAAVDKLQQLARRPGRGESLADARLEERFLYLPMAPKDYSTKSEELDDLFQAVADLKPLSCRYRSLERGEEEAIVIHPYAMVLHRDTIYCVGLHVARGEVRTFRVDRMRATECSTLERFEIPKDFRVDDWYAGEFGIWKGKERHRVVIDFDARGAEFMRMRRVHDTQRLSALPGGGLRLTMTVGALEQVVPWVLEWGPRARAVEPPLLVERVRSELAEACARYDAPVAQKARRKS